MNLWNWFLQGRRPRQLGEGLSWGLAQLWARAANSRGSPRNKGSLWLSPRGLELAIWLGTGTDEGSCRVGQAVE